MGGAFNIIHEGHKFFLQEAKKLGEELIVMISHDSLNRKKIRGRAVPATERKKNVEALGIVNKVIIGDPKDRMKIVREEKPDIIVVGYDQAMPELLTIKGIKIVRIKKQN